MNDMLVVSNLLLWLCVVGLSVVVLALVRQLGVLHERVAPAGALMPAAGPAVGEVAPQVVARTLDGDEVSIGGATDDGRMTLVYFLSPTCPVCSTLLPTVLAIAADEQRPARVVLASDGPADDHRRFVADHDLARVAYVLSTELAVAYQVGALPYAALIDAGGVLRARGVVNTREHLESLFEAHRRDVASIQGYLSDGDAGDRQRKGEAA